MKITKIRYVDETKNWVSLIFSDGTTATCSLKDGIKRQYTDKVKEYLENGGVIEPLYTPAQILIANKIKLTAQRNAELSKLTIDNILCDKESISAMNIKYSTMKDADVVEWITIDNDFATLTKSQLLDLITRATKIVGDTYIKYVTLKNEL